MKRLCSVMLCMLPLLTGCARDIHIHGFSFEHSDFDVKVGKTTRHDVLHSLGTPTSESDFGPKKYYYISRKVEKAAFFDPKVLEQRVLVIKFDKKDVVDNITELALDDANKVIFAEDYKEVKGNEMTVVQQILGNIGKYNNKKK